MITQKLLAIFFSFLILGQAWLVKRYVGTWVFPACLLGLFWFVYTFVPLIAVLPAPVEPLAVAYIFACCVSFSITALMFNWVRADEGRKISERIGQYDSYLLKLIFYSISIVSVVCIVLNWKLQGFTFFEIAFDFYQTSLKYVTLRNRGEVERNMVSQLGVVLTYPSAAIGGLLFGVSRKNNSGIHLIVISMLPSVLAMLVEGNKGMLFLALALFLGGVLAMRVLMSDGEVSNRISWWKLLFIGFILFALVLFAFVVRVHGIHAENKSYVAGRIVWYFLSYVCGHLYAYSDWFSWLLGKPAINSYVETSGGGFYTFMGLFRFLGDSRDVPPGVYGEYFRYGDLLQSNIYTIFRGLVIDFGLFGAVVFFGVIGIVVHAMFRWLVLTAGAAMPVAFFVFFVGFVYTSFIVSLLMWNSVFASFSITAALLFINNRYGRILFGGRGEG